MKKISWILKYDWIISLFLSLICYLIIFNLFYSTTLEYPEEDYKSIEAFLEKYIDTNNKIINYGMEIPKDITINYRETSAGPKIIAIKKLKNDQISCYALFSNNFEVTFSRTDKNEEEFIQHWNKCRIYLSLYSSIICLIMLLLSFNTIRSIFIIKE